jgi:hypothetical protein
MSLILDLAAALGQLAEGLSKISRVVYKNAEYGYKTFDLVASRRAKRRLLKLHKYGTELGAIQITFTSKLGWYMKSPSDANWEEAKDDIAKVLDAMSEIDRELEEEGGVFVVTQAYRGFVLAMAERKRLLKALMTSDATDRPDLKDIEVLQDRYTKLMEELEHLQIALSKYIQKNYPGEAQGFEDEGLNYPKPDPDNPPWVDKKP